jgi:myo-inositol-1(or 4)-monophosphatase/deoxyribonuclease-2
MLELLKEIGRQHGIMRIMGSATMTVVGVAAGRGSGAIIGNFSPIDHLAATLIVLESGGAVLNTDGDTDPFPSSGGVLVAAPVHARELHRIWRMAHASAHRV